MSDPTQPQADLPVVFLLDCDNTLLDNDGMKAAMDVGLVDALGIGGAREFWQTYERVRAEFGVVDLPLTFDWFTHGKEDTALGQRVTAIIMDFPFAEYVFPGAQRALAHLHTLGTPVIVSDGDTTFQPRKLAESGLARAVGWQAIVYVHKETQLDEIMRRWPARYYVMVDDKPRILTATKLAYPDRFVTVQIRQGHYAAQEVTTPPDISLGDIGELVDLSLADFERHLRR